MNMGFPDVCNTPAGPATVPIPYPNIGMNAQATPFSPNVMISQMNGLNMSSTIPMTSGDEGGVAHPMIKGPSRWTMGNPIVKLNYMPGINLGCPSTGNMANNALGAQTVPSVTNVFFTFATKEHHLSAAETRALTPADVAELQAALMDDRVTSRMLSDGTGVLRISLFSLVVPDLVETAIARLLRQGMKSLTIDLRGNRGGVLGAALWLVDRFVEAGTPILRLIHSDGLQQRFKALSTFRHQVPLTILVDGSTASAAEVFAGSLQAHGRAVLIGSPTYGKGTAQRVRSSEDGGGPILSTEAMLRLPGGADFDGVGLEPDIERSNNSELDS